MESNNDSPKEKRGHGRSLSHFFREVLPKLDLTRVDRKARSVITTYNEDVLFYKEDMQDQGAFIDSLVDSDDEKDEDYVDIRVGSSIETVRSWDDKTSEEQQFQQGETLSKVITLQNTFKYLSYHYYYYYSYYYKS